MGQDFLILSTFLRIIFTAKTFRGGYGYDQLEDTKSADTPLSPEI